MEADLISREELYELVWSTPMIKACEQFKVSGSYLARVCSALNVPRPERGYWAKLAFDKAPKRPLLPESRPGDQLSWQPGGELPQVPKPRPATAESPPPARSHRRVTGTHELIREARGHFDRGRTVEEGQQLRPYKRLMVDVTASRSGLEKALAFANDLFNALESKGHRVIIPPFAERLCRVHVDEHEEIPKTPRGENAYVYNRLWSPDRPTVVYVGSVAFGLAVIEMSEKVEMRYVNGKYIRESEYVPPKATTRYAEHTWTTTKEIPCGRLRLVIYAPYRGVDWVTMFHESQRKPLTKDIPTIVRSIEKSTDVIVEKVKEEKRQAELRHQEWEAQQERWRQEEDRRKVAQSVKESREQLEQVIQAWVKAVSLERFFEGVQARAHEFPETGRQEILDRLRLAREFVGTQEPLDFFRSWMTPLERYVPLAMQTAAPKQG